MFLAPSAKMKHFVLSYVIFFTEIRLVGGGECYGRLETRSSSDQPFGQACNRDATAADAEVVCRQLNCETSGASKVDPVQYVWSHIVQAASIDLAASISDP